MEATVFLKLRLDFWQAGLLLYSSTEFTIRTHPPVHFEKEEPGSLIQCPTHPKDGKKGLRDVETFPAGFYYFMVLMF